MFSCRDMLGTKYHFVLGPLIRDAALCKLSEAVEVIPDGAIASATCMAENHPRANSESLHWTASQIASSIYGPAMTFQWEVITRSRSPAALPTAAACSRISSTPTPFPFTSLRTSSRTSTHAWTGIFGVRNLTKEYLALSSSPTARAVVSEAPRPITPATALTFDVVTK
jgi:hypothetical protein